MQKFISQAFILTIFATSCVSTVRRVPYADGSTNIYVTGMSNGSPQRVAKIDQEAKSLCPKQYRLRNRVEDKSGVDVTIVCYDAQEEAKQTKEAEEIRSRQAQNERLQDSENEKAKERDLAALSRYLTKHCESIANPDGAACSEKVKIFEDSLPAADDPRIAKAHATNANLCRHEAVENYIKLCNRSGEYYGGLQDIRSQKIGIDLYKKACDSNEGAGCRNLYLLSYSVDRMNADKLLGKVLPVLQKECDAKYGDSCSALRDIASRCNQKNNLCKDLKLNVAKMEVDESSRAVAEREKQEQIDREERFRKDQLAIQERAAQAAQIDREERARRENAKAWEEVGKNYQQQINNIYSKPTPTRIDCDSNTYGKSTSTTCYGH